MTETAANRPAWLEPQRWIWPVLIGSLALNLVVAGSMLGQRLRPAHGPQHGPQHGPSPGVSARLAQDASVPLMRKLTPERRAEIRSIFEAHRGANRALWSAVRERRGEVTKVLESEPFDKAAYAAAMKRLIEAEASARSAAQPVFAEVAAILSAKERQDFLATHRQLRQEVLGPRRDGQPRDGRDSQLREGGDRREWAAPPGLEPAKDRK
jgi:uncharacterized membrane protein